MVILINGSPMYNGSTKRCLELISSNLSDKGVDNEIVDIPNGINHCINCRIFDILPRLKHVGFLGG